MIRGSSDPGLEERPAVAPGRPRAEPGHGEADFLVYEDERLSFDEHFRAAATLAHRLVERLRRAAGRPGRHRHAQLPRVVDRVLGRGRRSARSSCRSTRGGRRPSSSTAWRTPGVASCCSATPSGPSASPTTCRASPALRATIVAKPRRAAPRRRRRRRSRTCSATVDRRPSCPTSTSTPRTTPRSSTRRARPGRRRARSAPTATSAPTCCRLVLRRRRRGRCRGRPTRRRAAAAGARPERLPAVGAVLPRHRLPLDPRGQPGLRREDRASCTSGTPSGRSS